MSLSNNFPTIAPSLLLDFANTKTLGPRVTFTRASTATYYDGTTFAKAEENLLIYSQEFDNAAWTKQALAATANTSAAPDSTTTADTLTLAAGAGVHAVIQTATAVSGGRVASVFVKAGTASFVQLSFNTDTAPWANFNVTAGAGAVGSTGSNQTASIVDAGNGWYRCVVYTSSTTATNFYLTVVDSSTSARQQSWTAAGTETVLVWGAQLEQRSAATAYTVTTATPITNYNPQLMTAASGVARFDSNPTTSESLGLLIEESRTNLLTYSEQFDNAAWTKTNASISANVAIAPDGTQTVDKLVEDTANAGHFVVQSLSAVSGTAYAAAIYAKAGERSVLQASPSANYLTSGYANFDLAAGSVSASSANVAASIVPVGNGWYRCVAVFTANATASGGFAWYAQSSTTASRAAAYTGNGYSGVFIWGAQLEAGAFSTSYIQTVASQVTRSPDSAIIASPNFATWYNPAEGTFFARGLVPPGLAAFPYIYSASDGSQANQIAGYAHTSGLYASIRTNNVAQGAVGVSAVPVTGAQFKFATGYQQNNTVSSLNGTNGPAATAINVPGANVNQLRFGATALGAQFNNSCIQSLAYYPRRLTNAQLQALTAG